LRDVAEAVAGPDGRISATEAEELKRLSRGPAYTEQAPAALEVDRFVERESLQVRVTAESVASPDGFITPTEARKLPLNLRADYAFLTSTSVSDNDA
jgi:tellurite resistance protein